MQATKKQLAKALSAPIISLLDMCPADLWARVNRILTAALPKQWRVGCPMFLLSFPFLFVPFPSRCLTARLLPAGPGRRAGRVPHRRGAPSAAAGGAGGLRARAGGRPLPGGCQHGLGAHEGQASCRPFLRLAEGLSGAAHSGGMGHAGSGRYSRATRPLSPGAGALATTSLSSCTRRTRTWQSSCRSWQSCASGNPR